MKETQEIVRPFREYKRHRNFFDRINQAKGDRQPESISVTKAKQRKYRIF
jgi:hypothetical protein